MKRMIIYMAVWLAAVAVTYENPMPHRNLLPEVCPDSIHARLNRAALLDSVYFSAIDLSAGGLPLGELLRSIARVHGVNLCAKVDEERRVTCHFHRARLVDLLYFLCCEYRLNLEVAGNIISLSEPVASPIVPRIPHMSVDSMNGKLRYDLMDDRLADVAKRIAALTGVNVIVPRELYDRQVSGFSTGFSLPDAIRMLASANGLGAVREASGAWRILAPENLENGKKPVGSGYFRRLNFTPDQVKIDSAGRITVAVSRGNLHDIVLEVCERLRINRLFLDALDRQTSVFVENTDLPTLLHVLFAGTSYTYRCEGGIYIFGSTAKDKSFLSTCVIPLRYRTVEKVEELIPAALKSGMQLQPYIEQNSIIVSGTNHQVEQMARFLASIDQSIPLVTIEVLIVDSKKSVLREIGIDMGIGEPKNRSKTFSPGVDLLLNSASINRLINNFNGFGSMNLGKVTPDFYMNLKALEANGDIELRSTPKLATLNGHKASLKSGEKKYYKEVQTNYYGTQTPVPSESYTWKEVNADLSVEITPFVSKDGKITLNIVIEQSQFTGREGKIDEEAPPGAVTRKFESQVQIRGGETILLGGIDNNTREKSSDGLPLIARIPV